VTDGEYISGNVTLALILLAASAVEMPQSMPSCMASGINIYSFFSDIQKIFWISEKEFVISEILAH